MQKFGLHRSLTSGDVGSNNARSLVHQDNRAALGIYVHVGKLAGTTTGKL